jgi:Ca2+/H+ antiporter
MPEDTNVVVEKTISETIFGTPGGINRFIFFIVSLTSLIASAFLYIYFNKRFHHVEISKTVNLLIIVFITMLLLLGILYLIFFNFSIYAPISIASCAIILVAAIVQRVSFKTQEHSKIFQLQQIKDLKESRNDKIDNIILVADEFRRVHTKNKNLITLKYADNIVKSSKNTLA